MFLVALGTLCCARQLFCFAAALISICLPRSFGGSGPGLVGFGGPLGSGWGPGAAWWLGLGALGVAWGSGLGLGVLGGPVAVLELSFFLL